MRLCTCPHGWVLSHVHRGQERVSVVLSIFPPLSLRQDLYLNVGLTFPQLGWKPASPEILLSSSALELEFRQAGDTGLVWVLEFELWFS